MRGLLGRDGSGLRLALCRGLSSFQGGCLSPKLLHDGRQRLRDVATRYISSQSLRMFDSTGVHLVVLRGLHEATHSTDAYRMRRCWPYV